MTTKDDGVMRSFDTGATRDTAEGKLDFEGFLHPLFMEQFAKYMNMHRLQSDGKLRDSDNWQKGIPQDICMKSAFRHFFEMWKAHRAGAHCRRSYHDLMAGAMGLMFNIQAYVLHDLQDDNKGTVDFDGAEPTEEMRERQEKIKEKQVAEVGDQSCPVVRSLTPDGSMVLLCPLMWMMTAIVMSVDGKSVSVKMMLCQAVSTAGLLPSTYLSIHVIVATTLMIHSATSAPNNGAVRESFSFNWVITQPNLHRRRYYETI